MTRHSFLALAAGVLLVLLAGCATPRDDIAAYSDHLDQQAAAGRFSGVVLVAEDGRPLLHRGYGMADRTRGVANTPDTRFCIASMGKMFTAVAVAQLVGRGLLSFDDPAGKYVPGVPDPVTVRRLLTHTSGMGSSGPASPAEIVRRPLQFTPGSRFAYSNDGFVVLGAVVERVAGQPYADYVREHILEPAGMTSTEFGTYVPATVAGMAHGYVLTGADGRPVRPGPGATGTLRDNADMPQVASASGGASSTAMDMLRFAQALTGHRLLDAPLTDLVLAGKVDSPRPGGPAEAKYGFGFDDQRINGVRVVGHNGGTPGYEGQLDIYPDTGHVVVVLTNQDGTLVPAVQRSEDLLTR